MAAVDKMNFQFECGLCDQGIRNLLPAEVVFTLAARPKSLKLHFRPSHACNRELTGGRSGPEIWEWGGGG